MTLYQMTPIDNGTRLRKDHTTFSAVITSYNRGQTIVGDSVWEAPADGNEVRKGDKWLHVVSVDGVNVPEPGWMAYVHKGLPICKEFKVVEDVPPQPPPPSNPFPDSFTLITPDGKKAEYLFSRILE